MRVHPFGAILAQTQNWTIWLNPYHCLMQIKWLGWCGKFGIAKVDATFRKNGIEFGTKEKVLLLLMPNFGFGTRLDLFFVIEWDWDTPQKTTFGFVWNSYILSLYD